MNFKTVNFENAQKFVEKSAKCKLKCFGILVTSSTSFVIFTSSILVCIVIQEKEQNNQALNVLGVVLINYGQFLARLCLILFLESGKKLNPKGHHLLAQKPHIPRSTSLVLVLILVKILGICVGNFFPVCMSLNTYCCTSWRNFSSGLLYIGFNA